MQENLKLNNGTVFNNSYAIFSSPYLFLYINDGSSLQDVFDLLIVPANTEQIVYTQNNGDAITYAGFEKLICVRDQENGMITAMLRRTSDV